jgi:hypothetical protein
MGGVGSEYVRYLFCTGGLSYVLTYLTRTRLDLMMLMRATCITRAIGRGGP